MARRRDLSAIVQETDPAASRTTPATPIPAPAPAPQSEPSNEPSTEATTAAGTVEVEPTTRSTLDLPRSQHRALQRYALDVSERAGRSIRGQHVLRALVVRLQADEKLADQIARDLSQ